MRYGHPVLWTTSCFPITGPVAGGIVTVNTALKQVVINLQRIRQVAPHWLCRSIQWQQTAHQGR